jgi:hypothetical protein
MEKIDKRHVYGIMIDTETANGLDDPLAYDIGWQVIDSHGRKYAERSFVNRDIFIHERELMQSAYYANKIPMYAEQIRSGKRIMSNTFEIRKALAEDVAKYGCVFICAHNSFFDYHSTNNTQRWVTKSKYRYFIPFGLEWWDTMRMAKSVMFEMPTYKKFCEENGYFTSNGQMRCTAEILFQFISNDVNFKEEHTGLEDVDIERQILAYCKRQHKKMRKTLFNKKSA